MKYYRDKKYEGITYRVDDNNIWYYYNPLLFCWVEYPNNRSPAEHNIGKEISEKQIFIELL